jgi:hypothetical protein
MKPQTFRVRVGSNFDLNDSRQQYVVDFLLDCTSAVAKLRDASNTYRAEKASCQAILDEVGSLIKTITTDPSHKLRTYVKVDIALICVRIVERMALFSERTKTQGRRLLGEHLRAYL